MSQDSTKKRLLNHYLDLVINCNNNNIYFEKFAVLNNPELFMQFLQLYSTHLPKNFSYLCGIAPSGIPMSAGMSYITQKPLVLYHPRGWQRKNQPNTYVKPKINNNNRVVITDAHARTLLTSKFCYDYLIEDLGIRVNSIFTPVNFDICNNDYDNLPIKYLGDTEFVTEYISSKYKFCDINKLMLDIKNIKGEFWSLPPSSVFDNSLDEFRAKDPGRKIPAYIKGINLSARQFPQPTIIEETRLLLNRLESFQKQKYELAVWDILNHPKLLDQACKLFHKNIDINNYDYLIGIGHLGLVFATYLAFSSKPIFRGKIKVWLGEYGLLPKIDDLDGKKILPVSFRIQFGTYITDTLREIEKINGNVEKIVILVRDFNSNNLFERIRRFTLYTLKNNNIEIISLS